eukprot:CAMPEP_0206470496 /NCGR_PEP_ID=MMETSP0324_2-20121206/30970_1 /ASSEMBLY_ACC=CAM_ASM_000836 /TAXON_ID=2866 /ORGANISM="Crypthecodinium cohnii, Strain Seligo" /LENGTH=154 /DNA_ID=CAMNT_0053944577 /DNA_START=32 /DNA_END=496 /DNA_ORIENTATION=+
MSLFQMMNEIEQVVQTASAPIPPTSFGLRRIRRVWDLSNFAEKTLTMSKTASRESIESASTADIGEFDTSSDESEVEEEEKCKDHLDSVSNKGSGPFPILSESRSSVPETQVEDSLLSSTRLAQKEGEKKLGAGTEVMTHQQKHDPAREIYAQV